MLKRFWAGISIFGLTYFRFDVGVCLLDGFEKNSLSHVLNLNPRASVLLLPGSSFHRVWLTSWIFQQFPQSLESQLLQCGFTMFQHLLLLILLLSQTLHVNSRSKPMDLTKTGQTFSGRSLTNSWETYWPGRVRMPTYRVNLSGHKTHNTLSKRYAEDEIDDDVVKYMLYAQSALNMALYGF